MENLHSKAPCNFPELWVLGYDSRKLVSLVNITKMGNRTLEVILKHWASIGREWEYKLRF